jgi:N-acetylmuramoyl-L-alanine amidase
MNATDRSSPNFSDRPADIVIDMVVLHYTGMKSARAALDRMCDSSAAVSAHYMVGEDGAVWRLVGEEKRAWHAGVSYWAGATNINDRSIGIEIVNPGHEFGYRPFPEIQMRSVEELLAQILDRHSIPASRVVGHSDIAPSRKQDPGELFDWQRLAARRVSIWPSAVSPAIEARKAPALLAEIGYDPGAPLDDIVTAFQRRFAPDGVTGSLDGKTLALIAAVFAINS